MDMDQLLQFQSIAEYGTMAKVSERLHISQSALSRNLQRLETECGTPLFDRVKKRLVLNEAGRISLGYVVQITKAADEMKSALYQYYTRQPTLRIATCAPTPMIYLMSELGMALPEVTVQISWERNKNLENNLLSGNADLVISAVPPTIPGIETKLLFKETLLLAFHSSHPLASKSVITQQDLDGETIFQYANSGFWNEFCKARFQSTTIRQIEGYIVFQEMVHSSSQTCFATDSWASLHPELYQPNRVLVPLADSGYTAAYYLCYLSEQRNRWNSLLRNLKIQQSD